VLVLVLVLSALPLRHFARNGTQAAADPATARRLGDRAAWWRFYTTYASLPDATFPRWLS